jgi:hypothetical protein
MDVVDAAPSPTRLSGAQWLALSTTAARLADAFSVLPNVAANRQTADGEAGCGLSG